MGEFAKYKTVSRDDPDYRSLLLGSFSKTHRALPVETFHPQSTTERITFQLKPISEIQVPPWWQIYFWAARPELLGLTLGPAVVTWVGYIGTREEWSVWTSWFALIGLVFLHVAMFTLNDVQDHVGGLDRVHRKRGSQVIQRGWVTAAQMKVWFWVNLGLAIFFGLPAFAMRPLAMGIVLSAAVGCLTLVSRRTAVRFGLCDFALILLFGPLLSVGIALASFGVWGWSDAVVGLALGLLTTWVLQVRLIESLFRASPDSFRTFVAYLDFDRARFVILVESFLLLALEPTAALVLDVPLKLFVFLPLVSIPLILTVSKIWKAASPLSSNLIDSNRWALGSHFVWVIWWVVAAGARWL